MTIKCIFHISLLAAMFLPSKQVGIDDFVWRSGIKLDWRNLKATPNQSSKASAAVVCQVRVEYKSQKDTLFVDVRAVLVQSKSWYRKPYNSAAGLQHEQVHFDIAEVYARNLRKKIMSLKTQKSKVVEDLNTLSNINDQELSIFQNMYDTETDHGRNKKKQHEWEKIVAKQLKELELYKNNKVTILFFKG